MGTRTNGSRWAWAMAAGIVVLPLSGCFKHTYHVGDGAPAGQVVHDTWRHYWIAGLISPSDEIAINEVCPSGDATIYQEQTFLNGLVGVLTSGIFVPRTLEIRCGGDRRQIELDEDEVRRIVSDPGFLDWVGVTLPERMEDVRSARTAITDQ